MLQKNKSKKIKNLHWLDTDLCLPFQPVVKMAMSEFLFLFQTS